MSGLVKEIRQLILAPSCVNGGVDTEARGNAMRQSSQSEFVAALPVRQGDAFFYRRGTFSALIDGGRSRASLPILFRELLKRTDVDVLVCTHNDADHANG